MAVGQRFRRWYAGQWISLEGVVHAPVEHVPVQRRPNDQLVGATSGPAEVDMPDAGMSTVEYAVGTVVAAAFAAVLYKIVTGGSVVSGLTSLINSALHTSL
ncbi:Protein of unknown function [Nakamurella panacisegetis]|uniref:DUF4244 domain-containing protein n=2 Tax=Nakamurella panacisegetis TaxID=1090615 RepID=A0A1H0NA28_9ACTN|nr:DUF4244 domain-containing protein [Nakamurella panacisegetis]SDO89523.1 Protein of unknown function [Nakamurella panacisegetis]